MPNGRSPEWKPFLTTGARRGDCRSPYWRKKGTRHLEEFLLQGEPEGTLGDSHLQTVAIKDDRNNEKFSNLDGEGISIRIRG